MKLSETVQCWISIIIILAVATLFIRLMMLFT